MYIYVVRHGETNANVKGYLQGWTNDPLNESGRNLAVITGQRMKDIKFDYCISSPLDRAIETAKIILRESGNKIPITIDDRIKEIHMGDLEGKKFHPGECEVDMKLLELFFTDTSNFPGTPNGETIDEVCNRTQEFLKELLKRDDDKTYLVATHGCAMRAMLNFLYDNPDDFWHGHVPYNLAVNIIEGKNGVYKIIADDKIYYDSVDIIDRFSTT